MKLPMLEVLSDAELSQIHEASLEVLSRTGMLVYSPGVLEMLSRAGAKVDPGERRVRFPASLVEESLKSLPAKMELYDRTLRGSLCIGEGGRYVASGHNAVFMIDPDTGERRSAVKSDIADFARLADALSNIDLVGIQAMPQDVKAEASLLHAVQASLENTTKHIFFSPEAVRVTDAVIGMARAVAGRDDLLGCSPMTCQLSSTSPLFWETGAVESVVKVAEAGMPCAFLPQPYSGVTAPLTLAGLLTIHNAEVLSGIVINQAVRRGAPVIYASAWTTFDMKQANVIISSPEAALCRIAGAQLARFYHIPSHTIGPDADAHGHDEQNGWEKMMTTFSALSAGVDLLVNAGMFDTGLTVSLEQLVIDDDIVGWARRYLEGIRVEDDTIGVDTIDRVGPRGDFMAEDHTLKYLRSGEHWEPRVSNRSGYQMWKREGSPDIVARAKERAKEILASHRPEPLPDEAGGKVAAIISEFERAEGE